MIVFDESQFEEARECPVCELPHFCSSPMCLTYREKKMMEVAAQISVIDLIIAELMGLKEKLQDAG